MTDPLGAGVLGFSLVFVVVSVLVVGGILAVVGLILYRLIRYASATPQSARATCVAKRMDVRGASASMHGDGHLSSTPSRTDYYATFEMPDRSRKELAVPDRLYGMLAEGDRGTVTWKDVVLTQFQRDGAPPVGP